jgi:hypothetical protein
MQRIVVESPGPTPCLRTGPRQCPRTRRRLVAAAPWAADNPFPAAHSEHLARLWVGPWEPRAPAVVTLRVPVTTRLRSPLDLREVKPAARHDGCVPAGFTRHCRSGWIELHRLRPLSLCVFFSKAFRERMPAGFPSNVHIHLTSLRHTHLGSQRWTGPLVITPV